MEAETNLSTMFETVDSAAVLPPAAMSCTSTEQNSACNVQSARNSSASRARRRCRKSKHHAVSVDVDKKNCTLRVDTGGRILKQAQLEQIKHVIEGPKRGSTARGSASKKDQIDKFLEKYKNSSSFTDVSVSVMRHIIPVFLTEIYPRLYGQYSRKVKGMWDTRPQDWPRSVPFVDPNNKVKGHEQRTTKPTKEKLVPMLCHLVRKYENSTCLLKSLRNSGDQMLPQSEFGRAEEPLLQLHEYCSDELDGYGLPDWSQNSREGSLSGSNTTSFAEWSRYSSEAFDAVAGIPQMPSLSDGSGLASGSSLACSTGTHSSYRTQVTEPGDDACYSSIKSVSGSFHGTKPQQVEDMGEDELLDWKPVEDVIHRIKSKIKFLMKSKSLCESDVALLQAAQEILKTTLVELSDDQTSFIEKAHVLEVIIDIVKLNGGLFDEWRNKLEDYTQKLDYQVTVVKERPHEAANDSEILLLSHLEPNAFAITHFQPSDDLVSQLNIEKRPAVGDALLATTQVLEVRPGSLETHHSNDTDCSKAGACNNPTHWSEQRQAGAGLQETAGINLDGQALQSEVTRSGSEEYDEWMNDLVEVIDKDMTQQNYACHQSLAGHDKSGICQQVSGCQIPVDYLSQLSTSQRAGVPDSWRHPVPVSRHGVESSTDHSTSKLALSTMGYHMAMRERQFRSLPVKFVLNAGHHVGNSGCNDFLSLQHASSPSSRSHMTSSQGQVAQKPVTEASQQTFNSISLSTCNPAQAGVSLLPVKPHMTAHPQVDKHSCSEFNILPLQPARPVSSGPYMASSQWQMAQKAITVAPRQKFVSTVNATRAVQQVDSTAGHKLSLQHGSPVSSTPHMTSSQCLVAQTSSTKSHQQIFTLSSLPAANASQAIVPSLPTPVLDAMSAGSAGPMSSYAALNVLSPVGEIAGSFKDLSLNTLRYPLLHGVLTESLCQSSGIKDQRKASGDQRYGEDSAMPAAKRSAAPIPVMVGLLDYNDDDDDDGNKDDGRTFSAPSMKKVRASNFDH